jgi:hypothetical protein
MTYDQFLTDLCEHPPLRLRLKCWWHGVQIDEAMVEDILANKVNIQSTESQIKFFRRKGHSLGGAAEMTKHLIRPDVAWTSRAATRYGVSILVFIAIANLLLTIYRLWLERRK